MPRLPADAFERFMALGPERSYARLAGTLGVSKRSIVARASKEDWQGRLRSIAEQARLKHDARAVEDLRAIEARHLQMARVLQTRALEALRSLSMNNAAAAARTLEVAVKLERLILGIGGSERAEEGEDAPLPAGQVDRLIAIARSARATREARAAREGDAA